MEPSTWQLDQIVRILQASWLPFAPFLQNITMKDIGQQLPWSNNTHYPKDLRNVFKLISRSIDELFNTGKNNLCAPGLMRQWYPDIFPWMADYLETIHFGSNYVSEFWSYRD